jgi:hypothetical protein
MMSILHAEQREDPVALSDLPRMDMSYQTYTTPALSLSQKGSPDRISRVKNTAQQYAILYRPAALRRPHPHGGAQSSKPRRGNA